MALEQFAYVASHDLQEPLRTISAYAKLLARRYKQQLNGEPEHFLDLIVKGARRMSALVQDLLDYARVKTEIDRPSSYSLDQDLETALTQLQQRIEESNAVVTHDPLPEIQADQGQMVRLFQNLVGNALKYRKPDVQPEEKTRNGILSTLRHWPTRSRPWSACLAPHRLRWCVDWML